MTSPTTTNRIQGRVLEDPWPGDGLGYTYSNVQGFYQTLSSLSTSFENECRANGPWILFTDVDEKAFAAIQSSNHELACLCTIIYDPNNYSLSVKMESIFHSTLSMAITRWMDTEFLRMNLSHEILFTGTTNYELEILNRAGDQCCDEEGSPRVVRKRADQTIHPFSVPAPRTMRWPSFVLETAYNESRTIIERDIRLWLQSSSGQVRFAMTAFVNPRTQNITIEEWKLFDKSKKPNRSRFMAEKVQSMSIDKPKADEEPVVRGSLTIPFSEVFLRQPRSNEPDLVMQKSDIVHIARQVWRVNSIMVARKQ